MIYDRRKPMPARRPALPRAAPLRPAATKRQAITDRLRAEILAGDLRPGARLVIDDLARRFAVSIIPVREALHHLQAEGLVAIRPHTGVEVAGVDPASAAELAALMECLEIAAVRLAVTRATDADLARLEACCDALDAARRAGDPGHWAERNTTFHLAIVDAAGMGVGRDLAVRVLTGWERLRRWCFAPGAAVPAAQADREHRALAAALRRRDLAAAERITAGHIQAAAAALGAQGSARRTQRTRLAIRTSSR
jgi:DNA-binding GntR family transcriptional regulator